LTVRGFGFLIAARRRRKGAMAQQAFGLSSVKASTDSDLGASSGAHSAGAAAVCGSTSSAGCDSSCDCHALSVAQQLPLRLVPLLRTPLACGPVTSGCGSLHIKALRAFDMLSTQHYGMDWRCLVGAGDAPWLDGGGAVPAATCAALEPVAPRRRFTSQVRRSALRIRIVGAEPDQLPADWRTVVLAHFSGRCVEGTRFAACC
jgi:hypothetical protein